jgi:small subunit ribosomal protein S20
LLIEAKEEKTTMPQQMSERQRRLRAKRRKEVRKAEKRRLRNKAAKSEIKTYIRHLNEAIEAGNREQALFYLRRAERALDKAYVRGILPRNTVARKKSRLNRRFQKAFPPEATSEAA